MEYIETWVRANNDNDKLELTEEGILDVSAEENITISTGNYYLKGIKTSGKAKLNFIGKVNIFLAGELKTSGQSSFITSGNPYDLQIFSNYKGTDTISGQGLLKSIIYAPDKFIKISGNGISFGNIMGRTVQVSGNAMVQGFEYIEEKPAIMAASLMHVSMTGPSEEFVLGEVYSFPNPAKLCNPTIHFECGVADLVEIRIYNIAAELVKSLEMTDFPSIVNGKYTYEYTWDVSDVASGVYLCLVRAHKDGKVLKKIKKMAVIR